MPQEINVWLDDERDPNSESIQKMFGSFPNMVWIKNAQEAIDLLSTNKIQFISFDHDLGEGLNNTGYHVACWIEEHASSIVPFKWDCHSMNPIGSQKIISAMTTTEKIWLNHYSHS